MLRTHIVMLIDHTRLSGPEVFDLLTWSSEDPPPLRARRDQAVRKAFTERFYRQYFVEAEDIAQVFADWNGSEEARRPPVRPEGAESERKMFPGDLVSIEGELHVVCIWGFDRFWPRGESER